MDSLVSTVWLNDHIDDPELIVLDCSVVTVSDDDVGMRNFSGRESYNDGHIPGAGFADLVNDLCDNSSPIEFAMPTPQHFCAVMGALGVGDTSRVVLYDNSFSMWAARVWWMLRWVGLDQAAILDGGLGAWAAEKRPLSTDAVSRATRQLTPDPRPELIADKKEVLSAISDKSVSLIDSLPEEYFSGEQCMYARPGHIPTAKKYSSACLFG